MKRKSICAWMLTAALLTGCGAETSETQQTAAPEITVSGMAADTRFTEAQDAFAVGLLRESQRENKQENTMVSPYSVAMALAMTANGADGKTLSEMEEMLGGVPVEDLNQYLYEWAQHQPDTKTCKLKTANSVWYRKAAGFEVQPDFLSRCKAFYNADANARDFDQKTVDEVNDWVSDRTDKMIPKIVDELTPADQMILANAVCFDAKWLNPFEDDDVNDGIFTAADGTEQNATYLSATEHAYLELNGASGFMRQYDGDCAFIGILPPEGVTVQEYLDSLTREDFETLIRNRQAVETHVKFPEFTYDTELQLNPVLMTLGMEEAFSNGADFSRMANADLHVSRVIHKTHIEVDAKGTKAAAATAVMMQKNSIEEITESKTVILDRPFVYVILDTQNELPLFLGTVNQLSE